MPDYFWGKTGPLGDFGHSLCKPLLHHLLDVAAVALRIQRHDSHRLARGAARLGIEPNRLARAAAFLAGLHDLGKFSVSFQAKSPEHWPHGILGPHPGIVHDRGHWRNTAVILRWPDADRQLRELFPNLRFGISILADTIAGHHGVPARLDYSPHAFSSEKEVTGPCLEGAMQAISVLRELVAPEPIPEIGKQDLVKAVSWWLAGLTTLADWVGSDNAYFTFEDPATSFGEYWFHAQRQADRALAAKGLLPPPGRKGVGFSTLVPERTPRPMQAATDAIPLPKGPSFFVIEDTTGSGKTEAALTLAARLIEAGKAEGLYFALPTMATANAMHARLGFIHHRLFADGSRPSLVLAHGKAELARSLLAGANDAGNGSDSENNATWCAEWILDNRRKAFFADVGAGTIDQAFLAVLKKKHLTLRQYGLAGRVLIVDEAHAFDAYMSKELETLLQAHAALGGSAIVLSATMPAAKRTAIVEAFRTGCKWGLRDAGVEGEVFANDAAPASIPYPLMTVASHAGVELRRVPFSEALRRVVHVERLAHASSAHGRALEAARRGAAVLLIRNAVDEAIGSFEALRAEHVDTHLFHARFAMCDRQAIEREALARFGRDAESADRAGRILVATQVAEQSLDLDFDLVVTDLAPIDLLIQRAGRLWRHMDLRPENSRPVPGPMLCVISPDAREATHEKWLEPALGRGAFVYDHPGVMWRTARLLFHAGKLRIPEDLRPFIERVYGETDVPDCLDSAQRLAEGEGYAGRQLARMNLINFADGYPGIPDISPDQEIGTRMGEETRTMRLARFAGGKLVPWALDQLDLKQPEIETYAWETSLWSLSEVSVRKGWLGEARPAPSLARVTSTAKQSWPEWERETIPIAVVDEEGSVLLETERSPFKYSVDCGLMRQANLN